ncbi:MAG: hypothetical protein LH467_05095 [Gemmatimonadaceae bacterium]|nr:hypothetical protein [Gemmatimonadaceae bacterium]
MLNRHAALASSLLLGLAACSGDSSSPTALRADRALAQDAASGGTVVVTESDVSRQAEDTPPLGHWVLYTRGAGNGTFVTGPAEPPLGVGSITLTTPTPADKVQLFNFDHIGTKLADVRSMSYSTYRTTGTAEQVTAINVVIDFNGPRTAGGFSTLVFEPVYNPTQGPVVSNRWQNWDAYNGGNAIWWSTRKINGACAKLCYVTWGTIVSNNPDAVILGGFGLNQGSGGDALVASADALHLDTPNMSITYDFEPFRVATSKDACKDDGWRTLKRADGSGFKNQGDCVSYTENGK